MKKLLSILLFGCSAATFGQNWTWMRGGTTGSITGNYGTIGVSASTNDPGGRHGAATWTDNSGNLWVFGGEGYSNSTTLCWLNDLWKYDKSNNQWTWMRGSNGPNASGVYGTQGTASALNDPGAREFSVSWTDASGNFWLFGGDGHDGTGTFGKLGDLWKYNPTTNQWTWVKGFNTVDQYGVYGAMGTASSTNMPGGRMGSGYWIDANNNLWLFGGEGLASTGSSGKLNDLWQYNIASNQWVWMKGSNLVTQTGTYGTFSVSATGNTPGGKSFPSCFYSQGKLLMFGGVGHGTTTLNSLHNDFWSYDLVSNNWTWIGGSNSGNQNGNYGTKGQASSSVYPGSRYGAAAWVDALGKLWLFGGAGYPGLGSSGRLNDLFRYDPLTNMWMWVKGDATTFSPSTYGTKGVAAPLNTPGARMFNTWWTKTGSRLWLLGGEERNDTTFVNDHLNDLWVYNAPCNPDTVGTPFGQEFCSGQSATLSIIPPDNSLVNWYTSPAGTTTVGATGTLVTAPLTAVSSFSTYTFYVGAATCSLSPRTAVTITVHPLPQVAIMGPASSCVGNVVTFSATGAQTYTWHTNANGPALTATMALPSYTSSITGIDDKGCKNTATFATTVHPLPTVAISGPTAACAGVVVTYTASGTAQTYQWNTGTLGPLSNATMSIPGFTSVCVGIDANGCENSATLLTIVHPLPTVTATYTIIAKCILNPITLAASGASSYSWSTGHTASSFSIASLMPGTHSFVVTGFEKGCSSITTLTIGIDECIGLDDIDRNIRFIVYPNPTEQTITIELTENIHSCKLRVLNSLGQLVFQDQLSNIKQKLQLDLASGIYYVGVDQQPGIKLIVK